MREFRGDLWTFPAHWRCVTTNGIVKKNGELVMGAGVALEAKKRFPNLPLALGESVKECGNIPFFYHPGKIISFPTKHHYMDKSDIKLIEMSANRIMYMLSSPVAGEIIVLTRPGCGNGHLDWNTVREVIAPILDDRFVVVHP